jgi:uncharacterized membrane protein
MLAMLVKCPEIALPQDEADELGSAIARVNEVFGGIVVSEKTAALIGLATVAGKIYGVRGYAIYQRVTSSPKQQHTINSVPSANINEPMIATPQTVSSVPNPEITVL